MSAVKKGYCDKHEIEYEITEIYGRMVGCIACTNESLKSITVRESIEDEKQAESERVRLKFAKAFRDSGIPPRYTTRSLDNFRILSDGHQRVIDTVKRYIDNIDAAIEKGISMIFVGNYGTGKTHLACSIGNEFVKKDLTVAFMTVAGMFRFIRETYRQGSDKTEKQAVEALRAVDLLILDEIGVQKGSVSEEHLLTEVINERYNFFKPTILLSNLDANGIKGYIGERALDRLREGGGKLVVCDWSSYRGDVVGDGDLPTASGSIYRD